MLVDGNGGGLSAADVGAVLGNNRGGGFGGFNGDGAWWLIVLFLFALSGNNGWGGFGGGNGGAMPYLLSNGTNNDVQRGFDQQAVIGSLNGINSAVTSGFAAAESGRCNSTMEILQALNSNQAAATNGMNSLAMGLQNCCCENRAAVADLKYTVATEACADRSAVENALRDVLTSNNANTQRILDQMCQDKIDAKNEQIANLRQQMSMMQLQASQNAQTQALIANNDLQTAALEQYLAPVPRPAYVVQNPNCCQNSGCDCRYVS